MKPFQHPFRFQAGATLKNRLVLAPMTNTQSYADGTFSETELAWVKSRAKAGYGAIISAGSRSSATGQAFPGQIGSFSDAHIPGLKKFAETVRAEGALPILQIMHGGVRAPSELNGGERPVAPSEVVFDYPGFELPRALEEKEIVAIIADFASAAARAVQAGMGGIELHAANGYLHTPFFNRVNNVRTDRWGGTNENRARFILETIRAIRAAVPKDFVVGVRLLAEDTPIRKGFDIDDTVELIGWINDLGVDYLHVSSPSVAGTSWRHPESKVTNIAAVREALDPKVALLAAGSINTAADVSLALNEGADLVAVARAAIGTANWPQRIEDDAFVPAPYPRAPEELRAEGISETFMRYLNQHKLVKAGA